MFWRSTAILFSDYEFIIHVLAFSSSATGISFSGYEFIIHVLALNSSTTLILFSCKFIILFPVHVPTSVSGCTVSVTLQDVQLQCKMYSYSVRWIVAMWDVLLLCDTVWDLAAVWGVHCVRCTVTPWDAQSVWDVHHVRCTFALWDTVTVQDVQLYVEMYTCSVRCSHVQCVNHHCTEVYKHSEMYSYSVRLLLHCELYICSVSCTFVRCTVTQWAVHLQCEITVALWVVHMQCVMYMCEMYYYTVIGTVTMWDVQLSYCCSASCIFAVWDAQ